MKGRSELNMLTALTEWSEDNSRLGSTTWRKEDQSILLANMDFHQPHGYSADFAEYCVEAIGENITEGESADYWHFTDAEAALVKVIEVMNRDIDDEKLEQKLRDKAGSI